MPVMKRFFVFMIMIVTVLQAQTVISVSRSGDHQALSAMLKSSADVNNPDKFMKTALMYSCYDGDFEAVKMLIENGASLNAQDREGWTPLFYAAAKDRTEIAEYLIAKGADTELTDIDGKKAYDYALKKGFIKTAKAIK
jgi:ankyrin repeat protein